MIWLDHLGRDVRCVVRSMAASPIGVLVAILSLAGGIGSTTVMLTVRNAVFYNPPPLYYQPEMLSRVTVVTPESRRGAAVPGGLFRLWLADAELRTTMVAAGRQRAVELRTADGLQTIQSQAATAELFDLLGVRPLMGRTLVEARRDGGSPPVVIGYRLWRTVFAERPDALGSVVWIQQQPYVVAGIMPRHFWFGSNDVQAWTELAPESVTDRDRLNIVVRRAAGVTPSALSDRLQRDAIEYARRLPDGPHDARVLIKGVGGTRLADDMAIVIPWLLGAAVLLTLLIACANVAVLMFARWTAREHEMAIRSSLGASRSRAVRLLLTESVLIAACGGALGICTTFVLRGLLLANSPGAADFDLRIDRGILLQSSVVSILAGLVSGLAPALYETRRLQTNPLRMLGASDRTRQRWRHALVVLEITVTVALLVVAGSQIDASRRMLRTDLGFRTAPLLGVNVERASGVPAERIVERLKALPGVASAAASTAVPMATSPATERVARSADGSDAVVAERALIDSDYLTTMDVPVRTGRTFSRQEIDAGRVALVDETLARRLWPGRTAMGEHAWVAGTSYEVIGIVASYARDPFSRPQPRVFLPLSPQSRPPARMAFVVRAQANPGPLVQTIRREIRDLGADFDVSAFGFDQMLEVGAQEIVVLTIVMSPLIGMGLFLTGTGIFGVLAFAVTRRSKELALRVAIGASRSDVTRLIALRSLQLVIVGGVVGVGGRSR
jgi:predicted permease